MGLVDKASVERIQLLMKEHQLSPESRSVVGPARQAAREAEELGMGNKGIFCGAAMELPDGSIVTGYNTPLLHAASDLILNATRRLGGFSSEEDLLSPATFQSLTHLKKDVLRRERVSLDVEETLIALGMSAATDLRADAATQQLPTLRGLEMHMTHMPSPGDEAGLRKLGVNLTTDPHFASRKLFVS
jgi:uncharacterized protein (UPF0371 family)